MQINNINGVNNIYFKDASLENKKQELSETKQINSLTNVYPQNYYVSFGAGRDFNMAYADFKDSEMPVTVKNYIENEQLLLSEEDFKELTLKGLKYVQKLAFIKLKDCKNISDIQKAYPNEDAFKDMKNVQDIKNNVFGPLMKELDSQGKKILDTEEDVTTFLAKKIFLEGKMYKDVATDFLNALSQDAKDIGLDKAFRSVEHLGTSEFFAIFGLKTPNGTTYGSALQYSDPESTRYQKKYLKDMTPEQINEKIKTFLTASSTPKPKYAMMDAWNNCEDIRKDLSVFISENINNPLFMSTVDAKSFDIYDNVFYTQMGKLMIAFWEKYPEHKETLGKEIKIALERYDENYAIGGDKYIEYLKNIELKREEIKKTIEFEHVDYSEQFPEVMEIFNIIAEQGNPLIIKSDLANKDFANLLSRCFSLSEYNILSGSESTEAYEKLVPDGIKLKMKELIKCPDYSNLLNAQSIAYIKELLDEGKIDKQDIERLSKSKADISFYINDIKNTYKVINMNTKQFENIYNDYKKPLSSSQLKNVENELLKYTSLHSTEDIFNFNYMLSKQGKYLENVLSDTPLNELTQIQFWKEFDRINNTTYSTEVISNMKKAGILMMTNDVINNMDFSQIIKNNW